MAILQHRKSFMTRIIGKNESDIRIGELDLPKISGEDITADNLSDIINNGSAIVGETSLLHTTDFKQLCSISGVCDLIARSKKFICVYKEENDLLCKYDLIPYSSDDGQVKATFFLSEAWRMNPLNFKNVYQDQLTGYGCLYEDPTHDIFIGMLTVNLSYEEIIKELDSEGHAYFNLKYYEEYADRRDSLKDENN